MHLKSRFHSWHCLDAAIAVFFLAAVSAFGAGIDDAAWTGNVAEVNALLASDPALVTNTFFDGWTPLDEAADNGYYAIAKILVTAHADVNVRAKGGRTPLHLAILSGSVDMVELLLTYGANPNVRDENGVTPLHLAAWHGDAKIAELLLAHGGGVEAKDKAGQTPLDWALERGDAKMVRLLQGH